MLSELGLWAALRMFTQEFRERSGLRVDLDFDKELEAVQLDTTREMALYRFVQEALANVHRHSGSKTASVKVQLRNRAIEATVADAGRGMPQALLQEVRKSSGRAGGVGLAGMHERLSYAGGQLEIRSDERGTVLTAVLPVGDPAANSTEPLPRRKADDTVSHAFLMKPHSE
jgi:signal transduction histidine kinase